MTEPTANNRPRVDDLLGADPDYCGGTSVDEYIAEARGRRYVDHLDGDATNNDPANLRVVEPDFKAEGAAPTSSDRCSECGNEPGKWQMAGFEGGKRSEVWLNECDECGACWPSVGPGRRS